MPPGERKITSSREAAKPYLLPENGKVIIAMKGLPCTAKSEIAIRIGQWARCPVLSIDDFLDAVSLEKPESFPSKEEGERLRLLASYALYKMAHRHLDSYTCVVIKSRLSSSFELDLLMWLVEENDCDNLIVIESRMRNEYRYRTRLEEIVEASKDKEFGFKASSTSKSRCMIMEELEKHELSHIVKLRGHLEWYKATSWRDVENAKDECLDDQAWDDQLLCFINDHVSYPRFVTRLVVDPFDDLGLRIGSQFFKLPPDFLHLINHLFDRWFKDRYNYWTEEDEEDEEDLKDEWQQPSRYLVASFNELRRHLVKEELKSSILKERSKNLCSTDDDSCAFKYHRKFQGNRDEAYHCGLCQEQVQSRKPAYACRFCILTLHESCAKMIDFNFLEHIHDHPDRFFFFNYSDELYNLQDKITCNRCEAMGNGFTRECMSCLYETHLKHGFLPTIINHDGHEHFLSIQFKPDSLIGPDYGCHICNFYQEVNAFLLPGELKHEHGGYEHVMKLMYSHLHEDVTESEDDYWCNVCYGDMDPQPWFYSCQDCPYYITHLYCAGKKSFQEAIRNRKLAIRRYESRCKFNKDMMKLADDQIPWTHTAFS